MQRIKPVVNGALELLAAKGHGRQFARVNYSVVVSLFRRLCMNASKPRLRT